jgi:hypothetical protein
MLQLEELRDGVGRSTLLFWMSGDFRLNRYEREPVLQQLYIRVHASKVGCWREPTNAGHS